MPKALFLTRGDDLWGMGHLYRTSWLAGALAAQYRQDLRVEIHCPAAARARQFWSDTSFPVTFHDHPFSAAPPELPLDLAAAISPGDLVVVDWLDSPPEFTACLRRTGARIALLDDYGPARFSADLVINSLLAPLARREQVENGTRILSGADFIQVPPEVLKLRYCTGSTVRALETELSRPVALRDEVDSLLISFGGTPRDRIVPAVLKALARLRFPGRVVVMPAPAAAGIATVDLDLELRSAGSDFHSILAAVDLAVLGGGLSLYEALCLGTPSLAVAVSSAAPGYEHHQQWTIAKLAAAGCCVDLGSDDVIELSQVADKLAGVLIDPDQRRRMGARGMILIDGKGLDRSLILLLDLLN